MNSRDYWAMRSAQDMVDRMGTAEQTAAEMNRAIQQSSEYLAKEVKAVLRGMEGFGIPEAEAKMILRAAGDGSALQRLRRAAQQVGDPAMRQALTNAINSAGAYRYRIKRIEELYADITGVCGKLYQTEKLLTTSALRSVAEDSYYHELFNIQQRAGLWFSFSKYSRKDVDRILRANWSGGNYSQRIWKDMNGLSEQLKRELLVSMLTGRSNEKTARIFQERFRVNAYCARRIVRTESAYVANAAQMSAYDEAGVEKYRFIATLDSKTSEVCAALDGKVFEVSKAKPGKNYPPMHPFCRSTTIAEFGGDTLAGMERRARDKDGNTVKVPADMTYEEWYRRFVEGREQPRNESSEAEISALPGGRNVTIAESQTTPALFPEQQTAPALITANNSGSQTLTRGGNNGTDVKDLYDRIATPGKGIISRDDGYNIYTHKPEIEFADWLHSYYGGDIRLLNEINQDKVPTPDYLWNNRLWDLKSVTTEKAANSAIRKGLKQIAGNPGGVILDYGDTDISWEMLQSVIDKRMHWYCGTAIDIMVVNKKKVVKVMRYGQ